MVEADILTFLKILFFGGSTIITPTPVDIGPDAKEFIFPEKIEAITSGASLYIDITNYVSSRSVSGAFNEIEQKFPEGCVKAVLYGENEHKVVFDKSGRTFSSSDNIQLKLFSQNGAPVGIEFTSMEISSCKEIKNIVIKWQNYRK